MRLTTRAAGGRRRVAGTALAVGFVVVAAVSLTVVLSRAGSYEGRLLFNGTFSKGLSRWEVKIHPERISIQDDPILGARRKVAKFTVYDGDIGPTENPRAQIEGPKNLVNGGEYWIGWSTLFPKDFPSLPSGGWLGFASVYGPPYDDAGPIAMHIAGDDLRFGQDYSAEAPFSIPIPRGKWTDFAYHLKMSTNPAIGFVELHINTGSGWTQQSLNGKKRLYMATLNSSNNGGPNDFRLNLYRKRGMFDSATLYHAAPKVGTSFDVVKPDSYGD